MALYKWSIRLAGIGSFPDQIKYMSQDDYNALSEEAKMNGTTYGIVWASWENRTYEDVSQYIRCHSFCAGELWEWNIATKDWYVQPWAPGNCSVQQVYINWVTMWWLSHSWYGCVVWYPIRFYEWDEVTWWCKDIYYQDD